MHSSLRKRRHRSDLTMPRKKTGRKGKGAASREEQQQTSLPSPREEQQQTSLPSPREEQQQTSGPHPIASTSREDEPLIPPEVPTAVHQRKGEGTIAPQEKQLPRRKDESRINREAVGMRLVQSVALAKRPDYGTMGKSIRLLINYFPVVLPSGNVYHYDIDIIPKKMYPGPVGAKAKEKQFRPLNAKRSREVFNFMLQNSEEFSQCRPAYDGKKNMYTKHPLPNVPLTVTMELPDNPTDAGAQPRRTDAFEVSIKPVRKAGRSCAISLDPLHTFFEGATNDVPQETIMAVDAILRSGPSFKYVPLGQSFFYPPHPDDIHPLGGGKEIWFGYHQSLRLTQWKPIVNINVTARTFHRSGPVIRYISEILDCRDADYRIAHLNDADIRLLNKRLKGLKIKATHLGHTKSVLRVTREAANRLLFTMDTDRGRVQKTVSDYFLEKYKMKLRYPKYPCLQLPPNTKTIYLPLEVCEVIPGQPTNRSDRLSEDQSKEMIKVSALPPAVRFGEIRKVLLNFADFNNDPFNREFGISVSTDPMNVEGRTIDSPALLYNNKQSAIPRDGSWDMRGQQFFRGATISQWVIWSLVSPANCNRPSLERFANKLRNIAQQCGINLGLPIAIDIHDDRRTPVGMALKNYLSRFEEVKLAVVVLPQKNSDLHCVVKQAAENELGFVTQCVIKNTVEKCQDSVLIKLCQKINAKMGGMNNTLTPDCVPKIFQRPVIVIGADVNHPSPGPDGQTKPSIAVAVGTLDARIFRYSVSYRTQKSVDQNKQAVEIIEDLKGMVVELLEAFNRHTRGKKPEKIIFYRDGVGESQFLKVRDQEISAIRQACKSLNPDYEPGITFIVVQKRHHARFMPRDRGRGVGPGNNMPPGTIVDKGATSKINFDFFLCSHFGRQGTSRPGHYTVLVDDNDFGADDLQMVTYYLCHVYARCTSSIKIPVPVMYADLAAYRAREYLEARSDASSAGSTASGGNFEDLAATFFDAISVQPNLKDSMYYV